MSGVRTYKLRECDVAVRCSVFTVFQKKKTPQGDTDLYSLPTKQGEFSLFLCDMSPTEEDTSLHVTFEMLN